MYLSPAHSEQNVTAWHTSRRAATQRIANRSRLSGHDLANYFDAQMARLSIPALPAGPMRQRPTEVPVGHVPEVTAVTLALCATPTKSLLTRVDTGADGLLVTYGAHSVQATETTLADAIALVAPRPQYATVAGYQSVRKIMAVEMTDTEIYYAFQLIADRPAVWTWFKRTSCEVRAA